MEVNHLDLKINQQWVDKMKSYNKYPWSIRNVLKLYLTIGMMKDVTMEAAGTAKIITS